MKVVYAILLIFTALNVRANSLDDLVRCDTTPAHLSLNAAVQAVFSTTEPLTIRPVHPTHELILTNKILTFKTNDFLQYFDPKETLMGGVVFWKEGLTQPFDIATGDILVHRQIPFQTFGVELVNYGRYLVQFYQDKSCTSYTIEFYKNRVSTIAEVTALHDCD